MSWGMTTLYIYKNTTTKETKKITRNRKIQILRKSRTNIKGNKKPQREAIRLTQKATHQNQNSNQQTSKASKSVYTQQGIPVNK